MGIFNRFGLLFFYTAIFFLPIQKYGYIEILAGKILITDIFFGLSGLFLIPAMFYETVTLETIQLDGFLAAIALFLFAMLASTINSIDPELSSIRFIRVIHVASISIITWFILRDLSQCETVISVWLIATSVSVFAGLIGFVLFYMGFENLRENPFITHYGSLLPGPYPRLSGLFPGFNKFCCYLTISAVFAYYRKVKNPEKFRYSLLLAVIIFVAVFTLSPGIGGMLISIGLSISVLSVHQDGSKVAGHRFRVLFLFMFIAAGIAVFLASLLSPIGLLSGKIEPSPRVLTWLASFENFTEYPLTGQGVGVLGFIVEYVTASERTQLLQDAHNTWLSVAAQAGLFGVASLFIIVVYLLFYEKRCVSFQNLARYLNPSLKKKTDYIGTLKQTVIIAIIGSFLYHGLIQSTEWFRHQWVIWGMLASLKRLSEINMNKNFRQ